MMSDNNSMESFVSRVSCYRHANQEHYYEIHNVDRGDSWIRLEVQTKK